MSEVKCVRKKRTTKVESKEFEEWYKNKVPRIYINQCSDGKIVEIYKNETGINLSYSFVNKKRKQLKNIEQ